MIQPVVDGFEWVEMAIESQHNLGVHVGRLVAVERRNASVAEGSTSSHFRTRGTNSETEPTRVHKSY